MNAIESRVRLAQDNMEHLQNESNKSKTHDRNRKSQMQMHDMEVDSTLQMMRATILKQQ